MSWVAHDMEPYVIQKHFGRKIAFVPLLIGSYSPDLASKWFVYGVGLFGIEFKADNPAQFHRGFPGVGFTHSLSFGLLVGLLIFLVSGNRIWAFSFIVGQWAHALTDTLDTVGTMLLFPFTTHLFSFGAWAYAGQTGRYTDAGAYFSGLGFVWDGIWILWGLASWRVIKRGYFREIILPDPFWQKASRNLSEPVLLALYRASYFYGICRWVAWVIWAHLIHSFPLDLRWGGPSWVPAEHSSDLNSAGCPCPGCSAGQPKLMLIAGIAAYGRGADAWRSIGAVTPRLRRSAAGRTRRLRRRRSPPTRT